ncbi:hypothetical protein HDV05_007631 [Chytridiales sp. JEL 0842]|nr:hypothetical protein HDV05_007631 [Chytridiales sp. JEL 0842]
MADATTPQPTTPNPDGSFVDRVDGENVHITSQPEVDEASKEVQAMYNYFDELQKMVDIQVLQLKALNETEQELALFFQQKGYQEKVEDISALSIEIGAEYSRGVVKRTAAIQAVETFADFVRTFKSKAIQDSVDTMKKQEASRVEFDGFGAKLDTIQRSSAPGTTFLGKDLPSATEAQITSATEKELRHATAQFNDAKDRYLKLSTAICDKAVLLEMKREVDYKLQLEKLAKVKGELSETYGSALAGMDSNGVAGGYGVASYQVPMSD